jgi:hypothetical protein
MAIDWNAIYEEEFNKIEDPTARINTLKETDIKAIRTAADAQDALFGRTRDESKRQAYVTQQLNRRDMPTYMAALGLTGGPTETAIIDANRDYRNTVNSADRTYGDAATALKTNLAANEATVGSTYGQQLLQALENRKTQATNNASLRAQLLQAMEQAALQREQWDWQKSQAEAANTPIIATQQASAPIAAPEQSGVTTPQKVTNPYTIAGYGSYVNRNTGSVNPYTQAGYGIPGATKTKTEQQKASLISPAKQAVSTPYGTQYRYK